MGHLDTFRRGIQVNMNGWEDAFQQAGNHQPQRHCKEGRRKKKTNMILFFIEDVVVGYKVNPFSVNFVCSDCPHYFKSTIIFKIDFENQQITK